MPEQRCRVVVADDEPIARRGLQAALRAEPTIEVVAVCRTGEEALDAIRAHRPDLALLDIAMPTLTGVEVVRALAPPERPAVIFVTAFDRFAIEAFDLHAVDYLLKPFDRARFSVALERARARMHDAAGREAQLAGVLERFAARDTAQARIAVKQGDRVMLIPVADIDYCEAADNYVRIHAAGKKYLVRETLRAFEQRLDAASFARIHRSAVVNLTRVVELRPLFHGDYQVLLADGTKLTLSRSYREAVMGRVGAG